MLTDLPQTSTESILNDDTQHINDQIMEIEKQRSRFLTYILLLQGIWLLFMTQYSFYGLALFIAFPTILAVVVMKFDCGISKVKLQKITKCLLIYTLMRSLVWVSRGIYFGIYLIRNYGIAEDWVKSFLGQIGIALIIEILAGICTLQILRLTNRYFVLIHRKTSRGVTQDDFKYNC